MKKTSYLKAAFFGILIPALLIACNEKDERKELEAREEAKIGKVFNPAIQGNEHENQTNQFPSSRNKNDYSTAEPAVPAGADTAAAPTTNPDKPKTNSANATTPTPTSATSAKPTKE
ncbi:hypothetical protein FMM05_07485 [Flavobacterium zepuense]|uniref:Lipoprotein n=1 Tax=Flavobacterium zepuense TaxID=2593302 RepID=A0A552V3V9_9FLAO|nr:hypothetical protein [Flavobacterium zepuense]TRW25141.1 hypothetical protein FMM05_07485 [Flavobacterium zepuense]